MIDVPIAASGTLLAFAEAGMLRLIDFHLARRLAQLTGEADPDVMLACALAVRELRLGSVCVDLATAATRLQPEADLDDGSTEPQGAGLQWPEADAWVRLVAASPTVGTADRVDAPFRLNGSLLYLDRYWRQEQRLGALLRTRSSLTSEPRSVEFDADEQLDEHQRGAVESALTHLTTVITGGPGTGKTTIVARILDALADTTPRVALCAPTGKAAARLLQEVGGATGRTWGGTLHKLLGRRPRSAASEFGPENPLPYDVVVVDETSMVSLDLMAALVAALSPQTRLILLGDPHQLRSVEAGAVLADIESADDLVAAPGGSLARLHHNYRSNADINRLADAILAGDAEAAREAVESSATVALVEFAGDVDPASLATLRSDALDTATDVRACALAGDGDGANRALDSHRVLCGHREGPFGVTHWGRSLRGWLAGQLDGYGFDARPYAGQPLLIQRNSDLFSNGDTAVVVAGTDGELVAVVDRPEGALRVAPALLDDATDLHAMTIHKSQGSQFDRVSIVLPPLGSPLLTRELLYTAVTRAREGVRIYGTWEAFAEAVDTPVRRASGLARSGEGQPARTAAIAPAT